MCAPDPNAGARRAAQERQNAKHAKFGSESIKYWNRETTYKRGKSAAAIGFSRAKSDAYVKALNIIGSGRKSAETLQKQYAASRYVDEGGGSRRAGRNTLHALLQKTAQIDAASDDALGRNLDILHQGLTRDYITKQAKNKSRLGAPPEWGAPVMMPPRDRAGQFLATLQTGLSIASSVMTLGTTEIGKQAAKGVIGTEGYKAAVPGWTLFGSLGGR